MNEEPKYELTNHRAREYSAPWTEGNMTKNAAPLTGDFEEFTKKKDRNFRFGLEVTRNEWVMIAWALGATILGGIITGL